MNDPLKNLLKNLWTFTVFFTGWVKNLKTCEQGIFHRVRTCEKPSEMGGVYLADVARGLPPACPNKKYNVEVWFLSPSQREPVHAFKLY